MPFTYLGYTLWILYPPNGCYNNLSNGLLQEEIYISQPKGFVLSSIDKQVWHLLKSLYSLKQAL